MWQLKGMLIFDHEEANHDSFASGFQAVRRRRCFKFGDREFDPFKKT